MADAPHATLCSALPCLDEGSSSGAAAAVVGTVFRYRIVSWRKTRVRVGGLVVCVCSCMAFPGDWSSLDIDLLCENELMAWAGARYEY